MSQTSSAVLQVPVFIPAGNDRLFGIVSRPERPASRAAVITLPGAGVPSTGRNRFFVHLCRRLASEGYPTVRFDYHGIGESTGLIPRFRLDEPFTEDLQATIRWMESQQANDLVLVGSCFGARTALAGAARAANVKALVLILGPVRDMELGERSITGLPFRMSTWQYLRRALRPRVVASLFRREQRRRYVKLAKAKLRHVTSANRGGDVNRDRWVSPTVLKELVEVVRRRVPVLLIYGTEDEAYDDFERARAGRLGQILERGRDRITVTTVPGQIHSCARDMQATLSDVISDWLRLQPLTTVDEQGGIGGLQLD